MNSPYTRAAVLLVLAVLGPACGTKSSNKGPHITGWAWMGGSASKNISGIYGTKGVAAASNFPGGRSFAATWADLSGNVWIFGGEGYDINGTLGQLGDLWKFDGVNWTWMSGSTTVNSVAVYGTKNIAIGTNIPGARSRAATWTDLAGNFFLFGGMGYDTATLGSLNDLWRWDGTNWTWVSGDNTKDQLGVYGTKNVTAGTNKPGARTESIVWRTSLGSVFMFGGLGFNSTTGGQSLNDLWVFDGVDWTWLYGSNVNNAVATYGTMGTAAPANVPGGRAGASGWLVGNTLWLFGGQGLDTATTVGLLNDVWFYNGSWTWWAGSNTINPTGVYGTLGTPAASNQPGGRRSGTLWRDINSGLIWLFGGSGRATTGTVGLLNDLWLYDGANWTWWSGNNTLDGGGTYGTLGTVADVNLPGARFATVPFLDVFGNLWFLGGEGFDSATTSGRLNDIWRFSP